MKKIFSIPMVAIMTIGLLPVVGHTETSKDTSGNLIANYELAKNPESYSDGYFYKEKMAKQEKGESMRFIVKYKTCNSCDKNFFKTTAKSVFKELKEEKDKEISDLKENLSEIEPERLNSIQQSKKIKSIFTSSVSTKEIIEGKPEYETLELEESVDTNKFIENIQNAMGNSIEFIQPDVEMEISSVDTTEMVKALTNKNENLLQAHSASTGEGVTVALIDSAIDITHSDLQDSLILGWDFFNNKELTYSEEMSDDAIHGTHIAGIVSQVAPHAKIMPLKVFESGKAYTSDIIKAIEYAEKNGADIVNCSWGNSAENPALKEAMENSNMFFVAAAGNSRINLDETQVYPASYELDNIISVASVNQDSGMSYFSNYGNSVDIAAWGRDVYSTMPNNEHGNMNGTSMSAGYITGAAALAAANGTSITELKETLKASADKASTLENKVNDGNIVNFANIVYSVEPQESTYINAEDDFDRWTEKTPEQNWELFNSSKNLDVKMGDSSDNCLILKENGLVWLGCGFTKNEISDDCIIQKNAPHILSGVENIIKLDIYDDYIVLLNDSGEVYTCTTSQPVPMLVYGIEDISDVAAAPHSEYNLAIKADGTVWKWTDSDIKATKINALSNIKEVSIYNSISLALSNDGNVWIWTIGATSHEKCNALSNVKSILADGICKAVKNDGTVYSFIYHSYSKKCDLQLLDISNVKKAYKNDVFLKNDGSVWRTGENRYGQLGDGTLEDSNTYVKALLDRKVEKIASNAKTVLAIDEFGHLWGWGNNYSFYQCQSQAAQVPGLSNIKDLGVTWYTSLFLKSDGTVWGLGENRVYGKAEYFVYNRIFAENIPGYSVPVQMNIQDVKQIEPEREHTMFLKNDGTVWGWGVNRFLQLGVKEENKGDTINNPTKIDIENVKSFSTSFNNSVMLKEDGTVWILGMFHTIKSSASGLTEKLDEPTQIPDVSDIVQVVVDEEKALMLKEDGTVWIFPGVYSDNTLAPVVKVRNLTDVKEIGKTIAIKNDGTVWDIKYDGYNYSAQQREDINGVKSVGYEHNTTLVVKEDGTVWGWGIMYWDNGKYEEKTEATQIQGLKDIVLCKGGFGVCVALDVNGDVWVWGASQCGQLGNGCTLYASTPICIDGVALTSITTEPSVIEVPYNTPAEELDALLPTKATVMLDNNQPKPNMQITSWDKSEYKADVPGEYTVYGTVQLTDEIANPQSKKAEVTVKVPDPPTHDITEIPPIQITADQSIPLEKEGLEHAFGEPVTVSVPATVEAELDNGETAILNVIWDIDSYNPHRNGEQTIYGKVVLKEGIANPKKLKAELDITVTPAEYWIMDADPQTISIDVLAGTTKEEILEKIEPKNIDVDVMNAETGDEIYIYTGFTFSDEYTENTSYNPNQLGKQTLIGRFYDNFLDETTVPPCVEVEVNVVSSEIVSVPEKHVNAYQCAAFEQIENLPQKVTVTLENGMTTEVDVEWNSGNYERGIAGDQIITGNLVNLPSGVIQPEEEKTATLIVHVLPVNYEITAVTPDEDYFETDKDGNTLYAGFTLSELRSKLPVDKVKVQLTSVTEGIEFTTDYELDFTLEEENNPSYVPEEEYFDYLYGTLVLPDNISNPSNMLYEFTVYTSPVEIEEIEPVSVMVDYYTEFNDINLPDTVYVNLSNGQRKAIDVTWNSDGYNPDPDELTEDNPVVFNLSGTLYNVPLYINHYDTDIPQLTITLVLPRVYKITDIAPVRIPETGTRKINLGSSLSDIYDLIENHTATVTLENLKGVTSTQEVTFTLREEDNGHYDSMSEEEFELVAYLNISEGIENPDNKQLVISVRPTKYTIKTAVVSKVNGILAGTPFEEIAMPDAVTVNYTDTEVPQGEVPVASWDGSKYNPNKIGNQPIKGTFPDPLPVYVTNPNNRTPSALINVIDQSTKILSAKQITEATPFSALRRGIKQAETQTEEIEGYIERKYEVELLHKDGSISKEIVSIFNEITE